MYKDFEFLKRFGKLYEEEVYLKLFELALLNMRNMRNYQIKCIGDKDQNPDEWIESIDILEEWDDEEGKHKIGHEVKADITNALNGTPSTFGRPQDFQIQLAPWTRCKNQDFYMGTGYLFIETKSYRKDGWYQKLKAALNDGIERYLWFVLVKGNPILDKFKEGEIDYLETYTHEKWRNNVLLRVKAKNFIEVFERKCESYREVPNYNHSARGLLMPIQDLWQPPEVWRFEWVNSNGEKQTGIYEGVVSHPCTGTEAVLYTDNSRIPEMFQPSVMSK